MDNSKRKKLLICLFIELLMMGVVIGLDILTKVLIYQPIAEGGGDIILIEGVLRFTAVENTGASFGIFKDATTTLTIISILTVIVLLVIWAVMAKERNALLRTSLILIIGGGIGNFIDRVTLGYVRDFVYFELIDFAVFNVADSALTIGTILLLVFVIFFYGKDEKSKKDISKKKDTPNDN